MVGVAVTGMGCVTPLGNSVEEFWSGLRAGRSGIGPITRFDASRHEVRIAGEVRNLDTEAYGISPREARRGDLFALYGLVAASQALEHAGLARAGEPLGGFDPERTGVVIGTGIGGLGSIEEQSLNILEKGPRRVSPTLVPAAVPDVAGNEIALKYG